MNLYHEGRRYRIRNDNRLDMRYKAAREMGQIAAEPSIPSIWAKPALHNKVNLIKFKHKKRKRKTKYMVGLMICYIAFMGAMRLWIYIGEYQPEPIFSAVVHAAEPVTVSNQLMESDQYHTSITSVSVPEYCDIDEVMAEICKYDWDHKTAYAIAMSENGYEMWGNQWKADAVNTANDDGSYDVGVMMINSVHGYPQEELLTIEGNVRAGYNVYLMQTFRAWSDYNNGRYERYLR